ncbi:methyltransferase domain-containing protein [Anaerocolumna sedimenticola]|uniref:Methyltransferase domain-containing protein n=1 Tax=Anaerocolumna sedimenticola TaxID=2696063 RepID=A0A6P1TLP7_9FIRM|nr:class I SAM-dependent methyltransferase [Anaerocolumna sedimenticola]QHQ60836.1 methyltransferase domain-containing protein [Anaerocolumna sedimenticola]
MNKHTIIQKARAGFDEDFLKKNYMEERTGDVEHLLKILSHLNITSHSRILDLGTGSGFLAFPIAQADPENTVTGLDIAVRTLAQNREKASMMGLTNLNFMDYDGINFPFEDNTFNYVVTRYALHHFPDIEKSFIEISRVLKTGGILFISDPTPNGIDDIRFVDTFMQMKDDGHVKFYLKSEFTELAGKHGFQLIASFDSEIRFPSDRTEKYLQIADSIDETIIESYDLEVNQGQVFITEQVVNLMFKKL